MIVKYIYTRITVGLYMRLVLVAALPRSGRLGNNPVFTMQASLRICCIWQQSVLTPHSLSASKVICADAKLAS